MSTTPNAYEDFPSDGWLSRFVDWIADWGKVVLDNLEAVGDFAIFVQRAMVWLFTRLPKSETLLPNFHAVGVASLPVVA